MIGSAIALENRREQTTEISREQINEIGRMVEQLSGMIHEILETSKLNLTAEQPKQVDVSELLAEFSAFIAEW